MLQRFFIFFLLVICISFANAQSFPKSFEGHWQGTIKWSVASKPDREFPMQLIIKARDSGYYSWEIIYGANEKDSRPYTLKPVDTAKGRWKIDEHNGIILDNYVFNNSLHGAFTVMGSTIINSYTLNGDKLEVSFLTVKLDNVNATGNGTDESPNVSSYHIAGYQFGTLTRKN